MQAKNKGLQNELHTIRDTVESIWIAIVLAFILRAFIVEAFVIPTGSMAPRLMGEHWDLRCPNDGYEYAFGWPDPNVSPARGDEKMPVGAYCPNCDYRYAEKAYVNAGDRVLVNKVLYYFSDPQPWDVVVFKNPQDNQQNYIKRLAGLPGESIEIIHGDVFVKGKGEDAWRIRRKPAKAQEAMWQVVFDNDYQPGIAQPTKKWQILSGLKQWNLEGDSGRRLRFDGGAKAELKLQADASAFLPCYGYNPRPSLARTNLDELIEEGVDVCTDLKLSAVFVPQSADSQVSLTLSSFEHRFRADVRADGTVAVYHSGQLEGDDWPNAWLSPAKAIAPMEVGKGYEVALAHEDFQVILWVNGQRVFRSTDEQYSANYQSLKDRMRETRIKPIPAPWVRIAGQDGQFDLYHVALMRDAYYTSARLQPGKGGASQFAKELGVLAGSPTWGAMDHPITLAEHPENHDLDSFFMLGDNSPQSLDGRAWLAAAPTLRLWKHPDVDHSKQTLEYNKADALYQLGTVPRYNLIGKALFVYWPSGFRPPGMNSLPVIPNAGRMRLIR
jgi:signal peptidase I